MATLGTVSSGPKSFYFAHPQYFCGDLVAAWLVATVASALPSTLYAVVTGGDAMEATRAVGSILVPAAASLWTLVPAAAIVHMGISLFWASLLILTLPRKHVILFATLAAAAIGVFDLLVIGHFIPKVRALAFWPQLADHLMWGACFGFVLRQRSFHRSPVPRAFE